MITVHDFWLGRVVHFNNSDSAATYTAPGGRLPFEPPALIRPNLVACLVCTVQHYTIPGVAVSPTQSSIPQSSRPYERAFDEVVGSLDVQAVV